MKCVLFSPFFEVKGFSPRLQSQCGETLSAFLGRKGKLVTAKFFGEDLEVIHLTNRRASFLK